MKLSPRIACILRTDTTIEPFLDHCSEILILGRRQVEWQERCLRELGCEVRHITSLDQLPAEPCLVWRDDLFAHPKLVRRFVATAVAAGKPLSLGVVAGGWTYRTTILNPPQMQTVGGLQVVPYPLYYLPRGKADAAQLDTLPASCLHLREATVYPEGLEAFRPEGVDLRQGITDEPVLILDHWTQVLYANLFAFLAEWLDFSVRRLVWLLWRVVSAVIPGKWRVLGRLNRIGKNCDIHPTATLEGCILGDNVTVGAYSYLQGCYIGDGAIIEPQTRVFWSVLMAGMKLAAKAQSLMSVVYPGSVVSINGVQLVLVGRDTKLLAFSQYIDLKYKRPIMVSYKGRRVSLGTNNMGSCVGHRVIMGAFTLIDAGMSIPNDVMIVPDMTERILARLPENLPTGVPLVVRNRTVEPLELDGERKK